jgi:NADH-quinone oxidoreductase subunit N
VLALLPEIVLVLAALALLGAAVAFESRTRRTFPPATAILLASLGILAAGACLVLAPAPAGDVSPLVATDALSRAARALVLGLGLLAVWLPPARREFSHVGEYYALLLFALTGLLLTAGTNHLLFLFVALELASLSLYLLTGFPRSPRASEAALKYFLFGGISAAFLLFGISLIHGVTHAVTLPGVAHALADGPPPALAMAGLIMVLVGIAFKLAAAPFHYWAPDVYQGGPATTVALVAAASKAVVSGGVSAGWTVWLAILSAVSMIVGNLLALAQTGARRLLAYSAVANTGYLLVPLAAHDAKAAGTALFYVVVYGLATLGALAVTAAVERDRGTDQLTAFAGLAGRAPGQALALLVCLASLAGIPPLAGFTGKFALFSSALAATATAHHPGLLALVVLGAVLSAVSLYYYLALVKQAFVRPAPESTPAATTLPLGHTLAIGLPAALLIALGLMPSHLLAPLSRAVLHGLGR